MTPLPVIDLLIAGFELDATGAHVHEQVQEALQQFHGKIVSFQLTPMTLLFIALWLAMTEEKQAAGFRRPEVERDGTRLFGVPARECDVGLGCLEGHGVERCYVLTAEHQVTVETDLWIALDG